jgi:hypothetical protein
MGFLNPAHHDVFVSYAHVDNQPLAGEEGAPGWVSTLVRNLKILLSQNLGRDVVQVFFDPRLRGDCELAGELEGTVRDAAVFLAVLSRGYVASDWCMRELATFVAEARRRGGLGSRVFLVEFDDVERPRGLGDLLGYRFWVKDPDSGDLETLGFPRLYDTERDRPYFRKVNKLAREMAEVLRKHKESARNASGTLQSGRPTAPAPPATSAAQPQGLDSKPAPDPARIPTPAIHPSQIEAVRRALGQYIGPLADFIVDEQAKKSRDVNDLRRRVSAEIESEDDRREFLRIRPS